MCNNEEKMKIIYNALENGWSIKKSDTINKAFEFTKDVPIEEDYKGLVVFSKNSMPEDIENHIRNIDRIKKQKSKKRSISAPVYKNKQ